MRKRVWLWASVLGVFGTAVLVAVCMTLNFSGTDRICQGVTVEGINVGGLTTQQCASQMRAWAVKRANAHVILTALDSQWMGTTPDFGARLEWKKAVDRAYAVGREGNFINRAICVLTSGGSGKHIRVPVAVDAGRVAKAITKVAKAINRPHKDAKIQNVDGQLIISPDSQGIKLDEKRARAIVTAALKSNITLASLPVEADAPDVTSKDCASIDTLLARFTTPFNPGKADRTHNLSLAAKSINGLVIKPGMEFSYNDTVGPRELGTGFREAIVFVRGKMEPGVGGGICQVSSTLYNAVLMTGLKVVERHTHSRTVPYVTAGRDATVAYGSRDFRFRNPLGGSVGILTRMGGSHLTIDIYGSAADKKDITIFTGPVAYSSTQATKTMFDPTLPAGVHKIVDKGSRGAKVTVYRKIKSPDGSAVTETVSRDTYRPQPVIVGVGPTKKPLTTATPASNVSVAPKPINTD